MDNITDIFESDIQGADDVDFLDAGIATSAVLLQKLAAAEGVDLDSLPAEDVADLLIKMSGVEPTAPSTETPEADQTKEASMSTSNQITHADVSLELAKVAREENIDLSKVSSDQYEEAFNKLAADMQTPGYAARREAEKVAAEEDAKAYQTGVKIAEGFIDRVNQEATKKAEDEESDDSKAPPFVKKEKKDDEDDEEESDKEAGLAAAVSARSTKVASDVEELALKIARQHVLNAGFDPDTGEKLSGEAAKVAAAEARALELLQENGWV